MIKADFKTNIYPRKADKSLVVDILSTSWKNNIWPNITRVLCFKLCFFYCKSSAWGVNPFKLVCGIGILVILFDVFMFLSEFKPHMSPWLTIQTILPGGRLNKKDGLTRYGDSHVKDKTS